MNDQARPSELAAPATGDSAAPIVAATGHALPLSRRSTWVRFTVFVLGLVVLGIYVACDGGAVLADVGDWVDTLGFWGPVVFALCYALAVTALLPGSVLTASAGALFGLPLGAAVVLAGASAGSVLSFGIARWLGRPVVVRYAGSGRLARLDALLARRGFGAILMIRLVPLFPFSVINYGAGVSGVQFWAYLPATVVGIIPGTLVYTGFGGALSDPRSPMLWLALGALILLSVTGWWGARLLRSRLPESAGITGTKSEA